MLPTSRRSTSIAALALLAACSVPDAPDPRDPLLPIDGQWTLTQYERQVGDCDLPFIPSGSPITELRTDVVDQRLFVSWGRLGIIEQHEIRCPTSEDRTFACSPTSQTKRYHDVDDRVQTREITLRGYLLDIETEIEFYATAEERCEGLDCEGAWCAWQTTGRLLHESDPRAGEQK